MPADVIPEASRGGDKLSDLKNEMRAKAYEAAEYSESTSDGLAINLTHSPMPDVQMKSGTLGVPLAGPVKLDERQVPKFPLNSSMNNIFFSSGFRETLLIALTGHVT